MTVVPASRMWFYQPSFSPDGEFIYYPWVDNGVGTLYRVSPLGGESTKVIIDVDSRVTLSPDAYVFSDTVDGSGFWRPDSTSRRFRKLRVEHGLDDVTLYSLRHQAATTMIDNGVDAKTVSERLGNSVATVLGTYTRARTEADRDAAELLGRLYADE